MRLPAILLIAVFAFAHQAWARPRHHVRRHRFRPAVLARAAMVVDLTTGRTLYTKRADRRLPIASLTKLLTAMVSDCDAIASAAHASRRTASGGLP